MSFTAMNKQNSIQVFEEKQVCTIWDAAQEKWFFSINDVIAALTGNEREQGGKCQKALCMQ